MQSATQVGGAEQRKQTDAQVDEADIHTKQIEALWRAAGPVVQPRVQATISAMERHGQNTGRLTAVLLALIVATFGGVAAYALGLRYVDTAEKILIALISFLGGAAMFSGAPKK